MAIIYVNNVAFDTDDIIGRCHACNGPLYNAPQYIHMFPVPKNVFSDFVAGLWGVGYCPICKTVQIWSA